MDLGTKYKLIEIAGYVVITLIMYGIALMGLQYFVDSFVDAVAYNETHYERMADGK